MMLENIQWQELLNFTNANGEVITLFNGRITLSQALMILAAVLVILFALKVLKSIVRVIVIVVAICACLVHFNIASPAQIKDAATQIAQTGISGYQTIVDSSQNIRYEDGTIQVHLGDKWVNVSQVTSVVGGSSGKATVVAGGKSYVVEDTAVIQLLRMFT